MEHIEDHSEQIDAYLNGKMSETEKVEFEQQLKNDLQLAEQFKLQQETENGVRAFFNEELKKELQEIEKGLAASNRSASLFGNIQPFLSIAAVLIVLLVAGYLIFYNSSENHEFTELYSELYQPYPNVVSPTVRLLENESNQVSPFQLYEAGNYAEAIQEFRKIDNQMANEAIWFYLAQSYLALGNTEDARLILEKINTPEKHQFSGPTLWYLSLMDLQEGNMVDLKNRLKSLQENYPDYAEKAQQLNNLLEE